ncbi:DUF202 domain-containing protein [Rhodococcus sp. HM1]|uniref:DUF202 domain-containing protein n=1 Tax=Rhodococcus sp. HM1 TaxID=2937759 RepID=UPI00200ACC67|nr:DUF202 domain-containing protein [Rhodococcus sp. HM1]MCK8674813.1 DUF202 domain-containing protein [Rhodococcus sp. HM1]
MSPYTTHDDPGLQPERTSLAWLRTAAVLGAVALGFMRFTPGPDVAIVSIGLLCLTPALYLLITAGHGHRARVRRFAAGTVAHHWWRNLTVTVAVAVLALASAVLIATSG